MAAQWCTLLAAIAENPGERISRLALQSSSERARLLAQSNRVAPDCCDASVAELFAAQAARTPGSIAVREGTTTLSYAELDARANQLARFLGAQGVHRESVVAVALERGIEMTVALLGILKAGAAYLPLDPALPRQWLASMLEDAGQPLVLTQQRLLDRLPAGAARACCIDRDSADIAPQRPFRPRHSAPPAAIRRTSCTRRARPGGRRASSFRIVRSSGWSSAPTICNSAPGDVVAHIANPAFDASTFEIWGALLNGAQLASISYQTMLSPADVQPRARRARGDGDVRHDRAFQPARAVTRPTSSAVATCCSAAKRPNRAA